MLHLEGGNKERIMNMELTKKVQFILFWWVVGYCSETKKYCNELLERGDKE